MADIYPEQKVCSDCERNNIINFYIKYTIEFDYNNGITTYEYLCESCMHENIHQFGHEYMWGISEPKP